MSISIKMVSPEVADEITNLREASSRWMQIAERERAARLRNLRHALKLRKARRQIMRSPPEGWEQIAKAFIDKGLKDAADNKAAFNAHQKMLLDSEIRDLLRTDGLVHAVKRYRDWMKFNTGKVPSLRECIAYVDQVK